MCIDCYFSIFVLALNCEMPEMVDFAEHTHIDTLLGSHINFTCYTGYTYVDGGTSITITCMSSGSWSRNITHGCQRMYNIVSKQFKLITKSHISHEKHNSYVNLSKKITIIIL